MVVNIIRVERGCALPCWDEDGVYRRALEWLGGGRRRENGRGERVSEVAEEMSGVCKNSV